MAGGMKHDGMPMILLIDNWWFVYGFRSRNVYVNLHINRGRHVHCIELFHHVWSTAILSRSQPIISAGCNRDFDKRLARKLVWLLETIINSVVFSAYCPQLTEVSHLGAQVSNTIHCSIRRIYLVFICFIAHRNYNYKISARFLLSQFVI